MSQSSPKFTVVAQVHHARGKSIKINQVYDATPEEQRAMMEAAIVGYDPHHIDAPGERDRKFCPPGVNQYE